MSERKWWVRRRGQLFVELFIDDLKPAVALSAPNLAEATADYLVGFTNPRGGTNLCLVEYVATDKPVNVRRRWSQAERDRWVNSNVPVLVLAVDVAQNQMFYAWPADVVDSSDRSAARVEMTLAAVDAGAKREIRRRLVRGTRPKRAVAALA